MLAAIPPPAPKRRRGAANPPDRASWIETVTQELRGKKPTEDYVKQCVENGLYEQALTRLCSQGLKRIVQKEVAFDEDRDDSSGKAIWRAKISKGVFTGPLEGVGQALQAGSTLPEAREAAARGALHDLGMASEVPRFEQATGVTNDMLHVNVMAKTT